MRLGRLDWERERERERERECGSKPSPVAAERASHPAVGVGVGVGVGVAVVPLVVHREEVVARIARGGRNDGHRRTRHESDATVIAGSIITLTVELQGGKRERRQRL